MSKEFEEAFKLFQKDDLTVKDYLRIKELSRLVPENEERDIGWILEGLFLKIPDLVEKEGNDNFLEEEDK
mgnify:CR=1 FL=1|jgi:hypothetical protein|tara:strand:- start:60 stop:269 length:210 start_codon:yes stop_codon:yes gene_type:complete